MDAIVIQWYVNKWPGVLKVSHEFKQVNHDQPPSFDS